MTTHPAELATEPLTPPECFTPKSLARRKRPRANKLQIDIPPESPRPYMLARIPSEENVLVRGNSFNWPTSPSPALLSSRGPSPTALRRLSPNHRGGRDLSLSRELSFERKQFASPSIQRPAKRARPTLSLEIPIVTPGEGEHVLSLRRTGSWTEGSLADTADGSRGLAAEEVARAKAFVGQLVNSGVKLMAIDFDLTLVSMHTGGRWWGSADTLARSVRPVFKTIIPEALRQGIQVCVATLSSQTKLVANVLCASMPCDASMILVRGGEKTLFTEKGEQDTADVYGNRKQKHIASILCDREARGDGALLSHQIILIDDDSWNVEEALENSMRALVFNPDNPMQLCVGVDSAMSFDVDNLAFN